MSACGLILEPQKLSCSRPH